MVEKQNSPKARSGMWKLYWQWKPKWRIEIVWSMRWAWATATSASINPWADYVDDGLSNLSRLWNIAR